MNDYIQEQNDIFERRFKKVDECVVNSNIFKLVHDAFNKNMNAWQITPEQKALAFADFMSKTAIGFISIATESALKIGISVEQEESEKQKREKELSLADEQINKTNHEKELLAEQVLVVKNQAKNELLKANSLELDSEIKKEQVAAAKITALSEAQKINVLIKTANDNLNLKQSELLVEYLKILSTDSDVKLTEANIHKTILAKIENLNKSQLSPVENAINSILSKPLENKDIILQEKDLIVNILVTNYSPLIDEKVGISLISNTIIDSKQIEYTHENIKKTGKKVYFSFSQAGEKIINVSVKDNNLNTLYTNKISLNVKEIK